MLMGSTKQSASEPFHVAPYFDVLMQRLEAGDRRMTIAFGRHVHWGYWPQPELADGTPEDYARAAERLCRKVCDAAGIRDGMRVLDVGCGFGGTIASLNERFSRLDLVGVNIDARQLHRARETVRASNGNRIRFLEADACQLPFEASSFDAVLAVECIFHFDSRPAFLAGAARCLAPGGRLALSDLVPRQEIMDQLTRYDPGQDEATRKSYGQVDLRCSVEQYHQLAAEAGLTLLSSDNISENTLPTYPFLRADLRDWPDRQTARWHERATARLEIVSRLDLLRYTILSFARSSCAALSA
jgi:cyclopropane fatty-acyl-phospholipid synthase-like methyltransferase